MTTGNQDESNERPKGHGLSSMNPLSRRETLGALAGLSIIGGSGLAQGNPSTTAASTASEPVEDFDHVLINGKWKINYYSGYEDDAEQIADNLNFAEETLTDDIYPHEYDRETIVKLYHPEEYGMWRMSAGHWWGEGGITKSTVNTPTPSDHELDGEERDEWFLTNIAHEYVHLPQVKDYGQTLTDPTWFTEGMAEYLSNYYVEQAAGYEVGEEKTVVDSPIKNGNGYSYIVAGHTYPGGHRLFQFLAEEYGVTNVTALTRSDEDTIVDAIEVELGLKPLAFESEWLQWAEKNIGGEYEKPPFDGETARTATTSNHRKHPHRPPQVEISGSNAGVETQLRGDIFDAAGKPVTIDKPQQGTKTSQRPTTTTTRSRRQSRRTAQTNNFDDVLSIDHFDIHYYQEYQDDANLVAGWLESMVDAYNNIYQHPEINTDVLLYDTGEHDQRRLGSFPGDKIEMLTPSQHSKTGDDRNEWYVSSIGTGYFDRLISDEFPESFTLPAWLTAGVGGYIGRRHVDEGIEAEAEQGKFTELAENGSAHLLQIGVNQWTNESWVYEAIAETHDNILTAVIESDQPTLAERFEEDTNLHPYHVEPTYVQWLNNTYDANYDLSPRLDQEQGGDEDEDNNQDEDGERTVAYYANPETGSVGTNKLQNAIDDWLAGTIDTNLLQEVINAWLSGEQVN